MKKLAFMFVFLALILVSHSAQAVVSANFPSATTHYYNVNEVDGYNHAVVDSFIDSNVVATIIDPAGNVVYWLFIDAYGNTYYSEDAVNWTLY